MNRLRWRAVMIARAVKELFRSSATATAHVAAFYAWTLSQWRMPARLRAWAYRAVFTVDGTTLRRAGEHVLADLREYTFAQRSTFDPDPYIAARRAGRRDVWLRLTEYLNLDEAQVITLMEIDDGI